MYRICFKHHSNRLHLWMEFFPSSFAMDLTFDLGKKKGQSPVSIKVSASLSSAQDHNRWYPRDGSAQSFSSPTTFPAVVPIRQWHQSHIVSMKAYAGNGFPAAAKALADIIG